MLVVRLDPLRQTQHTIDLALWHTLVASYTNVCLSIDNGNDLTSSHKRFIRRDHIIFTCVSSSWGVRPAFGILSAVSIRVMTM
jgi:hypothetical protein